VPHEVSSSSAHQIQVRADSPVVALINVFTVPAERQQELCDQIDRTFDEVMRHQAGFIAASVHRSLDGTKVVN
jgi:hypothetical protein